MLLAEEARPDFVLTCDPDKLNLGPGTWKLYCTLPGHDQAGMHALITVAG